MTSNLLMDAALNYAARGWPVFPCHHPTPVGGCSCGHASCSSPAKHPTTRRGLNDASRDPDRIRRWWQQRSSANVAIRTGSVSGLVVVDLDPPHGAENFRRLAARRLPTALAVVRTGSGGTHLYFRHAGPPIRNSAGRLAPGVDVRGEGGYILAPPSRHITGNRYQSRLSEELPDLPDWLSARLQEPERRSQPHVTTSPRLGPRSWTQAVCDDELRAVMTAAVGSRNTTLNRAAYRLGRLAARADLDVDALHDQLTRAAMTAGLPPREAVRTATSGIDAGLRAGPETTRPLL